MVKLIEMDEDVSLREQMQEEGGGPVVLINRFKVPPDGVGQLLQAWQADAAFLKTQPGYISAQLHRGIGGSCTFVNYAVWESVESFRRAFQPARVSGQAGALSRRRIGIPASVP